MIDSIPGLHPRAVRPGIPVSVFGEFGFQAPSASTCAESNESSSVMQYLREKLLRALRARLAEELVLGRVLDDLA